MYTVPVKGIAALHAHYTQRPRSVHAPYRQIHKDACNYTHVVNAVDVILRVKLHAVIQLELINYV